MDNFFKFKGYFDFILEKHFYNNLSEFIYNQEEFKQHINFELVEDLDDESYDSYGNEDTKLNRIYYFPTFNIHVSFYGTRCSYNGTDWEGYKEVKPITKTITTWE